MRTMSRGLTVVAGFVTGVVGGFAPAARAAEVVIPPPFPVHYNLHAEYTEGCFDPCACPIMVGAMAVGTFTLTPVTLTGTLDTYAVDDVQLALTLPGGAEHDVTGSGTYQIFSEFAVTHRLQLDLTTGFDGSVEHYDSGWVVGGFEFPSIDIVVSINGMFCYDKVFDIDAAPQPQPSPADLNGDGVVTGLDLALLLGQWGRCPICIIGPCPCPADLSGDGQVNGIDLAMLLAAWTTPTA